jgi:hypothetical protein
LLLQTKIEDLLSRRNEVLEVDGTHQAHGAAENAADYELRISDAHRKMEVMRTKFERLRTVCISSDQALKGVLDRVKIALREMEPSELAPASKIPQGTPPRQGKKLDRRDRYAVRNVCDSAFELPRDPEYGACLLPAVGVKNKSVLESYE